jgi:hypothetical protein
MGILTAPAVPVRESLQLPEDAHRAGRIPLWSMLGWAALLLLLSAATAVTAVFAVVIVLLLAGSVFELVFRHPDEETATAPA